MYMCPPCVSGDSINNLDNEFYNLIHFSLINKLTNKRDLSSIKISHIQTQISLIRPLVLADTIDHMTFYMIEKMVKYLKLINCNENCISQATNCMQNGYTIMDIINMIKLSSVSSDHRHYALCKYKCEHDFSQLDYILDEEILFRVWSELFFSARNKNERFNVNYQLPRNGNTLLMLAAKFNHYECVIALCARNAYVNLMNNSHCNVFDFLEDRNHKNFNEIKSILRHFLTCDSNMYRKSIITPDWTCYSTRITNNNNSERYSCGSGSGGGGDSSPGSCSPVENRYSAGYKGMSANGCGAIYSGFNF